MNKKNTMQTPWSFVVKGSSAAASWTADVDQQLIILSAVFESSKQPVRSALDHPQDDGAMAVIMASQDSEAGEGIAPCAKILLCATITPAAHDTAYDGYATHAPPTILAASPLHGSGNGAIHFTQSMKLSVRPGATIEFSLVPTAPVSAERLAHVKVTCVGIMLNDLPPPSGWRPVIDAKWFVVKPSIRKTTVVHAPPHILSPSRRAGEVLEAQAVSSCGNHIMWTNRVVTLQSEVQPYRRSYTPARIDKPVRIRRFPHRNADVIGFVPFGEHRLAVGHVVEHDTQDVYIRWQSGGWSRTNGTGGAFLVEDRFSSATNAALPSTLGGGSASTDQLSGCTVFEQPRLYTSSREGRGVRVRFEPQLTSKQIGMMEPNEVREAIALHRNEVGVEFVEWKAGGFSCLGGPHGSFLFHMIPNQPLRCHPLRSSRGPPSPEVISLDRRKRSREDMERNEDEDDLEDILPLRRSEGTPEAVGISPHLIPSDLRRELASGKTSLTNLPRVNMNGDEDDSGEDSDDSGEEVDESDSDFEDSFDDEDGSDEECYSTDDYDDDAVESD